MGANLRSYQERLTAALASGDLPAVGIGRVAVHHGRKCRIFRGGACTCVPDISIHVGNEDVAVVGPDGSVSRVKQS